MIEEVSEGAGARPDRDEPVRRAVGHPGRAADPARAGLGPRHPGVLDRRRQRVPRHRALSRVQVGLEGFSESLAQEARRRSASTSAWSSRPAPARLGRAVSTRRQRPASARCVRRSPRATKRRSNRASQRPPAPPSSSSSTPTSRRCGRFLRRRDAGDDPRRVRAPARQLGGAGRPSPTARTGRSRREPRLGVDRRRGGRTGIDLAGTRAVVTGGASGIGDRDRARAGRRGRRGHARGPRHRGGRADRRRHRRHAAPRSPRLDLADQASVAAFVAAWDGPLHLLVNNAGVMALPELSAPPKAGRLQFATNHLGHFALALGLHDALAAADGARIVSVSSSAHLRSPVVFDDIHFAFRPVRPVARLRPVEDRERAVRRRGDRAAGPATASRANALHAGRHRDEPPAPRDPRGPRAMQRAAGGRAAARRRPSRAPPRPCCVATSPALEGVGGRYFEDCDEAEVVERRGSTAARGGVAPLRARPGQRRAPVGRLRAAARSVSRDVVHDVRVRPRAPVLAAVEPGDRLVVAGLEPRSRRAAKFSSIRSGVVDFGEDGMLPRSMCQRRTTCAGVRPSRSAMPVITGSSSTPPGRSGTTPRWRCRAPAGRRAPHR